MFVKFTGFSAVLLYFSKCKVHWTQLLSDTAVAKLLLLLSDLVIMIYPYGLQYTSLSCHELKKKKFGLSK